MKNENEVKDVSVDETTEEELVVNDPYANICTSCEG